MPKDNPENHKRMTEESIVETVREPLIVLDADLRVISANKSFYRSFKVNPKETQGRLIYDLGNRQWNIPKLRKLLEEILPKSTTIENYEVEHDFKTIGPKTMLLNARRLESTHMILLAIEDVTERKKAEYTLTISETKFRRLFESTQDGILILDAKTGMIVDVNPFLIQLLGFSQKEFLAKKIWDIGLFKDIAANKAQFLKLQKKKYVRYEDLPLETKSGKRIYIEFISNVFNVDNQKVIQCNIRDMTERKNVEGLIAEKTKLESYIEGMSDGVVILTIKGRVINVNKAYSRMFGREKGEVVGKSAFSVGDLQKKEFLGALSMIKEIIQKGSVKNRELTLLNKEKKEVPILFSATLIKDSHGKPESIFAVFKDITERKKAEDALRESEKHFRNLADSISDVFFAMDKDLRYTYWNRASEKLTGIKVKDAIGKSISEIFPDREDTRKAIAMYRKALKTQQPQNFMNEYQLKGENFFFEINAYPSRDCLSVFVKDITERKKVEEKIKTFSDAIAGAFDCFLISDIQGNITYVNESAIRAFGYTLKEFLSMNMSKLDVDPEAGKKVMQEIVVKGKWSGEVMNIRKNKQKFPSLLSAFIIKDEEGNPKGAMGILRDITERKQAEDALKKAATEWKNTFDSIPDMIFIMDRNSTILRANLRFAEVVKMKPEEIAGKKCYHILHKSGKHWASCPFEKTLKDGKPHTEEVDDPEIGVPLLVTTSPIFNEKSELTGAVHVARDISEMKKIDDDIRKRTEELERFSKLSVGRELKMVELKKKIKKLEDELNSIKGGNK